MESEQPEPNLDVAELAASLRADAADLSIYARVLTTSLADALPVGVIEVDRRRRLGDLIAGREGTPTAVRVNFDDQSFELTQTSKLGPKARVITQSGGVVISRKEVPIAVWAQQLAERLASLADESQDASVALARLLGL